MSSDNDILSMLANDAELADLLILTPSEVESPTKDVVKPKVEQEKPLEVLDFVF